MILKKHKNSLLTMIRESGLDPNLFTAKDGTIDNHKYFIISLHNSPIRFGVRPDSSSFDMFFCRYSEFRPNFPLNDYPVLVSNTEILKEHFYTWLDDNVKTYIDEINTPDLWQILEETRSQTKRELGAPRDLEPFSDEEKIQINLSLDDFRLLIVNNFEPDNEELKAIDARLEYLSDALNKHNRFDWKGIAITTVISITIALSLSPEQGNQLFQFFKQVFSNVLYLLSSG